jgi:hypothetical protein
MRLSKKQGALRRTPVPSSESRIDASKISSGVKTIRSFLRRLAGALPPAIPLLAQRATFDSGYNPLIVLHAQSALARLGSPRLAG